MSIGQALAAARREAGMSVEQVSAATRIRRTIISAIEADDFSLCGGDFYTRAHIRSVAQAVGIDAAPLLAQYDGSNRSEVGPVEPVQAEVVRPGRGGPNWSAAMAAALVLVVLVVGYRVVTGESEPTTRGPSASPSGVPTSRPPATTRSSPRPPSPAPTDVVARAPRTGVTVQLRATVGASWVSVTNAAGRQLYQGLLAKGTTRTVSDPAKVRLVVGNAGAVTLVVNGKAVGAPGRLGSVARVEFGPGDPAAG